MCKQTSLLDGYDQPTFALDHVIKIILSCQLRVYKGPYDLLEVICKYKQVKCVVVPHYFFHLVHVEICFNMVSMRMQFWRGLGIITPVFRLQAKALDTRCA
jgi:hypothetical protein